MEHCEVVTETLRDAMQNCKSVSSVFERERSSFFMVRNIPHITDHPMDLPCGSPPIIEPSKHNDSSSESNAAHTRPVLTAPPHPTFIQIEPVGQSNLACVMCPVHQRIDAPRDGRPALMPFKRYTKLLGQYTSLKKLYLQGFVGPRKPPHFCRKIKTAVSKGLSVRCNLNCTLVSDA